MALEGNPKPAISARHLWHRYGSEDVLRDVSFEVQRGDIFAFIGPNGAGKTTTIRIMASLLEPTAGRVEIDGVDVTMEPVKVRKRIGYMADHAGVYPRMTTAEYLRFFAASHDLEDDTIVDAVIELTDIRSLRDRLVSNMSKGQKQRLQLARILLHDPSVLILDEPASDLDPRARIEIRDLLVDLQALGKTVLLSSHILSELSDVCTSVGIIDGGRMLVAGPMGEIGDQLDRLGRLKGGQADATVGEADGASPERQLRLRVLGDPQLVIDCALGLDGVLEARPAGPVVAITYQGEQEQVAYIVRKLVEADVMIVGVEQDRNDLERLFLEATHREDRS